MLPCIKLELDQWPGDTPPDATVATGLDWTDGATSLQLWYTELNGVQVTKVVTVGEYSNAEPFAVAGHLTTEQMLVQYKEMLSPQ